MSNITDRYVIDLMAIKDRVVEMDIIDTLPWTYTTRTEHTNALIHKLNDYLNFIYGGQIYEQHPKGTFDSVQIRLIGQYPFSQYALNLFEKIKLQMKPGCNFVWNHGSEALEDGFSDDFVFDSQKVYPRLKKNWAKDPFKEIALFNYSAPDGKLNAPMLRLWDSYVELFMQDMGDQFIYLDYDKLPEDIDVHALSQRAHENLVENVTYRMEESREKGIYGILAGGDFEAESLCFNDIWKDCSNILDGDLCIAVPTKDMVLFTKLDDTKLVKKLFKMAERTYIRNESESPELLFSIDVFEYHRDTKELTVTDKQFMKKELRFS